MSSYALLPHMDTLLSNPFEEYLSDLMNDDDTGVVPGFDAVSSFDTSSMSSSMISEEMESMEAMPSSKRKRTTEMTTEERSAARMVRNRLSAEKSRRAKKEEMQSLKQENARLKQELTLLRAEMMRLEEA